MRWLLALLLVPAALLGTPAAAPAGTRTDADLARAIERRLDAAGLTAGKYGVAVLRRGARPQVVFARGHTRPLVPASVAKVLTAAAALDLLGPAHVFTTRVTARGELGEDGVLHGDLVVHGTGDPNLSGRFHDGRPTALLDAFARAVADAGIVRVEGALVLDDGPFDREGVHPTWKAADLTRWYGAPVAGLAFNDGCADIVVKGAAREGQAATVLVPSTVGFWQLENRVRTVGRGRPKVGGLWVRSDSVLRVQGEIAKGVSYPFSHPVPDALAFFGGAFVESLRREGVHLERGVRPARDDADREPGALLVGQHGSGLPETLRVMNRRSQNFYASLLFKACGAELEGWGTWESGERAIGAMLERRGLDATHTRIVDGSGLSTSNRTTAATVARLLVSFESDLMRGPLLYDSLAVPGREGTLRRRLRVDGLTERLHAKTGTLAGVTALAGYVDGRDGSAGYAFAILLNDRRGTRALIDEIVREIARR